MDNLRELTLRGMILGALITVVFTASNVYLGLKVGLTFSSAIPAAVISMAVLRLFADSNILENNMVQTQASAAGTLSAVIFVLPAMLMIGYWQSFHFIQTLLICSAGGILGVVFSVPLRRVMVVQSDLPYPEGVAAAEILKTGASEKGDSKGGLKDILFGGFIAAIVSFLTGGLRILAGSAALWFQTGKAVFQLPMGFSLALFSAGYLVGITSGIAILIGAIIAWVFAIPIISTTMTMEEGQSLAKFGMGIWANKARYIGAGTLAIASIWTLITLFKPMIEGIKLSAKAISSSETDSNIPRTDKDLSPKALIILSLLMIIVLIVTFYSFISSANFPMYISWILVLSSVLFAFIMGFLVAAACGYMAGLVGSSASPISGIGIIAITIISLLLLGIGEVTGILNTPENTAFVTALAIFVTSAVVAMAAIANDNLQDLKTGLLVKATPWRQQVALIIGCVIGAIVIAPILGLLHQAYGFEGAMPREGMDLQQVLGAPQATLMKTIAESIFTHQMEWVMIITGLIIGATIIFIDFILFRTGKKFRIPALAVGMGIYLPPTITLPLIVGAVVSWGLFRHVNKITENNTVKSKELNSKVTHKGTLIASGLIVGESLIGVLIAGIIVVSVTNGGSDAPLSIVNNLGNIVGHNNVGVVTQILGLAVFVTVCTIFIRKALSAINNK